MPKGKPTLLLLRGLPGSGKTTLGATLAASCMWPLHEADHYFYDGDGNYNFDPAYLPEAHAQCQERTESCLRQNQSCVVANTATTEWEVQQYAAIAERTGAVLQTVIVENRHGGESRHAVPKATIARMADRFEVKL